MTPTRPSLPRIAAVAALVAAALASPGCRDEGVVRAGRSVLGTAVNATVYGEPARTRPALDKAYARMNAVEGQLDPYDATSAVAAINASPGEWHELPPDALAVYEAVDRLGVGAEFSPAMWGVTRLYDFGGKGSVPTTRQLSAATFAASRTYRKGSRVALYAPGGLVVPESLRTTPTPAPGFDFGGASKGLALDRAGAVLASEPGVTGFLLSAMSSTLTSGAKDDDEPWRVGIEDPRQPGRVIATIAYSGRRPLSVSTSGDYQTYFERDGVRYHHLLDPATGRPARSVRSLTVFGPISSLDADVLSTALFVMGPARALAYAREHAIGVYIVDAQGRASGCTPPLPGLRLSTEQPPLP